MGINFPASPAIDTLHPVPAVPGLPQYRWDGVTWVAVQATSAQYVRLIGDTMTGPLALEDAPTQPLHATNKQYVDAAAGDVTGKVDRSGDSMLGVLNLIGAGNIKAAPGYGCGFFWDTSAAVQAFYVGSHGGAEAWTVHVSGLGDVISVPVAGGVPNFPLGATRPNIPGTDSSTKIANTEYVERRGSEWGAAHASLRVAKAGDTMTGALAAQGGVTMTSTAIYYGSAALGNVAVVGNSTYACVSFLNPTYFLAQLGLANDGNFYTGGGSFGEGIAYNFWTSRHFSAPVTTTRLTYAGDFYYTAAGIEEPYSGIAPVTGGWTRNNYLRHRYLQMLINGAWYNTSTA